MRRDLWRGVVLTPLVVVALACAHDDEPARARLLASPASRHLVGAWNVEFRLDRARSISVRALDTGSVTGTLVFAEDRFGRVASSELGESTHDGVYDVSFTPFGFSSRAEGDVPVAIARVVPTAQGESLYVVLSPGTTRLAVRMAGTLAGDSATGAWRAAAFSAGGGAGTFRMHRRRAEP
jgi:hypothetical protein